MELSSDAEKLSLILDTRKVLSSLQPGIYPRRELAWLLTTTWNRGCHHAKYRRLQEAQQFMEAALSLVGFCPEFQARQEVCKKFLAYGFSPGKPKVRAQVSMPPGTLTDCCAGARSRAEACDRPSEDQRSNGSGLIAAMH